jgi:hypothetical protein
LQPIRSLQEGQTVQFNVVKGPKGWQAEYVQPGLTSEVARSIQGGFGRPFLYFAAGCGGTEVFPGMRRSLRLRRFPARPPNLNQQYGKDLCLHSRVSSGSKNAAHHWMCGVRRFAFVRPSH